MSRTHLLLPNQISPFWEAIKKCVSAANEVDTKDLPSYLNELLHCLLSSKAQCFVRLDDSSILEAIAITRVLYDSQRNEKYLYVQSLYSWQIQDESVWRKDIEFMLNFAKSEGCSYIGCQSRNPGAWKIFGYLGMQEVTRIFSVRVN